MPFSIAAPAARGKLNSMIAASASRMNLNPFRFVDMVFSFLIFVPAG